MKNSIMILVIAALVLISGCSPPATITAPTPSGGGWVKSPYNPLLKEGSLAGWMVLKADPVVIKDGDVYKMWFTGAGNDLIQIGYATSEDGIDWDVYPEPVFERGEPGAWDEHGVETAFVMKDDNIYKLWYSGQTTEDVKEMIAAGLGGRNILPAIGYATSEDGINWTRHGDKPVIGQRTDILWHGEQDAYVSFSDPHVIKEDGIYKMWFQGNGGGTYADLHEIGYATSQDGVNWKLHPDNPVFRVDAAGSFDSIWVAQPSIIKRGHSYEMWYGAGYQKELDSSAEGMEALQTYLGRATSADGIQWTRDPDNPILGPGISGSGLWEEDGAFMPTVILDGDALKMWYVGVGRQGSWYPDLVRGFQYQIGYAEKGIEDADGETAVPLFRGGFEEADTLEDLVPEDLSRWHGGRLTVDENRIELTTEQLHSGTQALKFIARPYGGGDNVSKAYIDRGGLPFANGDEVWTEMWLYIVGGADTANLFLWDLEAPDTCFLRQCQSPGRRLYLSGPDGDWLNSDLGKWWRGKTFRQTPGAETPFPKDRWVRVRVYLRLSPGTDGVMKVWQDDDLVLDANGRTLPNADAVYERLQVGVTANGNEQDVNTIYLDDVTIWDKEPNWEWNR